MAPPLWKNCFCGIKIQNNENPHLWLAVVQKNLEPFTKLRDLGQDINPATGCGCTPFHMAANLGLKDMFNFFFNNVDEKNPQNDLGCTPLHLASGEGSFSICEKLVIWLQENSRDPNPRCNMGLSPLYKAARTGHLKIVNFFCNTMQLQNPRIHDELGHEHAVLHIAARYGHLPIVKSILEVLDHGNKNPASSHDGVTPLHCAATSLKGKLEVLELFLKYGVDINVKDKNGMTALFHAATKGNTAACRLLSGSMPFSKANNGCTPLHAAAYDGDLEIFKVLCPRGQDISPKNEDGDTPLHFAAQTGHLKMFEYIFWNMTEKNPGNNKKTTPLHIAAEHDHKSIVSFIIKNIDDKHPKNDFEETPKDVAANEDIRCLFN